MDMPRATVEALRRSRLLATLDDATLDGLVPKMEFVALQVRDPLYELDQPMAHAYFPIEGVVSMVASIDGGPDGSVEVATVGNEGMLGLSLFLGASRTPGFAFAQVAGSAWRIGAADFEAATRKAGPLTRLLHRYTQALLVQISQGTACNRVHTVQERCARWLLMTHDRVPGDEFHLTQQFLGQMLGERRPAVNAVAALLQRAGFIRYARGRISVLDRPGLESASCSCYRIVRDEYDRSLGSPAAREEPWPNRGSSSTAP